MWGGSESHAPENKKPEAGIITVYIPVGLIDKVKNIVYWTPGLTIAGFAEEALAHEVDKCERERGEKFPRR